jgi:dienelactone hydrolase
MKTSIILVLIFVSLTFSNAQTPTLPDIVRVEANANAGFSYPYYLHIPAALRDAKERGKEQTFIVLPNNTGKIDDDIAVHEESVKTQIERSRISAAALGVVALIPVFPRPSTDWKIYTHALDRDSMLTYKKEYARFDLQLIAMIDDARARLAKEDLKMDKRVFIRGFSASGMFANRFTFLHPDRVKAAVVGSPGGWPIAPVESVDGKTLRYPIGIGDLKLVSGEKFDLKAVRKVPMFIFVGDQDDNDSVIFGDGYDQEDTDLIFALFGKTPIDRWEKIKKLYADNKLNATFKLYPGVKHTVTMDMYNDLVAFLKPLK